MTSRVTCGTLANVPIRPLILVLLRHQYSLTADYRSLETLFLDVLNVQKRLQPLRQFGRPAAVGAQPGAVAVPGVVHTQPAIHNIRLNEFR